MSSFARPALRSKRSWFFGRDVILVSSAGAVRSEPDSSPWMSLLNFSSFPHSSSFSLFWHESPLLSRRSPEHFMKGLSFYPFSLFVGERELSFGSIVPPPPAASFRKGSGSHPRPDPHDPQPRTCLPNQSPDFRSFSPTASRLPQDIANI